MIAYDAASGNKLWTFQVGWGVGAPPMTYEVDGKQYVTVAAGGASHIFKPRAVGEGMGRTWYAPWSSASAYALPILAGAKMTQMENRIVLTRFKDGYGPVGAYFLHLKTYTQNAYGQDYEAFWRDSIEKLVGDYVNRHPVPTCLRNHALLEEVKAGRGPIRMVTKEAFQDPHNETVGWENFLGMTIGALPHMAAGRPVGVTGMASRLVAVSVVAFIFRPLSGGPSHFRFCSGVPNLLSGGVAISVWTATAIPRPPAPTRAISSSRTIALK